MNWIKWIIASLIGGVAYFFAGWIVYGILFNDFFSGSEARTTIAYAADDFKVSFMALSCLLMGAFLSYIFIRWAGIKTFLTGAINGALIACFMALIGGLSLAAEYTVFGIDFVLYDTVANALCTAIAGGLIGLYLGRSSD